MGGQRNELRPTTCAPAACGGSTADAINGSPSLCHLDFPAPSSARRSFTTHTGTVSAADDWDTPVQCKQVCDGTVCAAVLRQALLRAMPLSFRLLPELRLPSRVLTAVFLCLPQVRKSMPGSYEHLFHK